MSGSSVFIRPLPSLPKTLSSLQNPVQLSLHKLMASMEFERSPKTAEKRPGEKDSHINLKDSKNNEKKSKKRSRFMPKFGCFRLDDDYPAIEISDAHGSFDMEAASTAMDRPPAHLIVMVNGLNGSAQHWRFSAKQFLKNYPQDVIVHCSERNTATLTFDGVDAMGKRLADEVMSVVKHHPSLQKISFIGHSLGGLVARYAIALLYGHDNSSKYSQVNGEFGVDESRDPYSPENFEGKIAGLEPVNFITFATPHLGSRGHKQVPVFCGFYTMEKAASVIFPWLLGRTVRHLFLTDNGEGKPPLLLQMVNDCEDLKFISSLQAFRHRVAYANAHYDHLVGWSSSSLRRRNELPKLCHFSRNDKYPHIVNIEIAKHANPQQEISLELKVNAFKTDEMEETMIRALTQMSWERVDVSFEGSKQRYFAHNTIQVTTYFFNSDGADVVQHMIDNFLL